MLTECRAHSPSTEVVSVTDAMTMRHGNRTEVRQHLMSSCMCWIVSKLMFMYMFIHVALILLILLAQLILL